MSSDVLLPPPPPLGIFLNDPLITGGTVPYFSFSLSLILPPSLTVQDAAGGAESALLPQGSESRVPTGGAQDVQDTEVCPSHSCRDAKLEQIQISLVPRPERY